MNIGINISSVVVFTLQVHMFYLDKIYVNGMLNGLVNSLYEPVSLCVILYQYSAVCVHCLSKDIGIYHHIFTYIGHFPLISVKKRKNEHGNICNVKSSISPIFEGIIFKFLLVRINDLSVF